MTVEYFSIFLFLLISIALSAVIIGLSYILAAQKSDSEKVSIYECGFIPFSETRTKFDVRFYLVAILFIIFDLEVSFLFPWAVVLSKITTVGFWTMFIFLLILTIGFIYEWKKGALEWD